MSELIAYFSRTGDNYVSAAVFGGGRSTWRLQLTLKLIKRAGAWKTSAAEAATY